MEAGRTGERAAQLATEQLDIDYLNYTHCDGDLQSLYKN